MTDMVNQHDDGLREPTAEDVEAGKRMVADVLKDGPLHKSFTEDLEIGMPQGVRRARFIVTSSEGKDLHNLMRDLGWTSWETREVTSRRADDAKAS